MKQKFNLRIYNVVMPRCRYCKHYQKYYDLNDKPGHYCDANFNEGKLIYQDTLDQCDCLEGFENKKGGHVNG